MLSYHRIYAHFKLLYMQGNKDVTVSQEAQHTVLPDAWVLSHPAVRAYVKERTLTHLGVLMFLTRFFFSPEHRFF